MGSDLPPKAAQTTLLDLDESHFRENHDSSKLRIDEFAVFAKEAFRSYKQSNQRIDTFRLSLETDWYGVSGLVARWTSKALKLGATDLTFRFSYKNYRREIFIPDEAFAAEGMVRLCLENMRIDHRQEVIKCSGLKSLTFTEMSLTSYCLFRIISSCPLIENLSLSNIHDPGKRVQPPVPRIPDGWTISLSKLTSLVLSYVEPSEILNLFLGDSSSKFPNLKDLKLCLVLLREREEKQVYWISNHSLEIFDFRVHGCQYDDYRNREKRMDDYMIELDVPSIRKFTFKGPCIPNVSFRSSISGYQWEESRVSIYNWDGLSALWFCKLSDFLRKLTRSKIHLCLHLRDKNFFDYLIGEIDEGLGLVELEDLTMDTKGLPCLGFNALLDGLFRIFRPKMITQYSSPRNINDRFLCRALIGKGVEVKSLLIISQFMLSLLDLEEVSAQKLFDGKWIPQPLDSVLDDDSSAQDSVLDDDDSSAQDSVFDDDSVLDDDSQTKFRLKLKWKP